MASGVFGKLPDKRDYVQHGVDPALMQVLDPWLQACQQESRATFGDAWLDIYLTAPIIRFWLGSGIAGQTVIGALMPSVDGVGRYFPLLVVGAYDGCPPPDRNRQPVWFTAAEAALLSALADDGTYDALLSAVVSLPGPDLTTDAADDAADDVAAGFAEATLQVLAQYTMWWIPADPATGRRAFTGLWRGMPPAAAYARMIEPDAGADDGAMTGGGAC